MNEYISKKVNLEFSNLGIRYMGTLGYTESISSIGRSSPQYYQEKKRTQFH